MYIKLYLGVSLFMGISTLYANYDPTRPKITDIDDIKVIMIKKTFDQDLVYLNNGKVLKLGSYLNGLQVIKIRSDMILLSNGQHEKILYLFKDIK